MTQKFSLNVNGTSPFDADPRCFTPCAIANAIFDATDVRVRRVPVSPDRVKMALS